MTIPWVCGGDFNNILHACEKIGGQRVHLAKIEDFQQCVERCGFVDMR